VGSRAGTRCTVRSGVVGRGGLGESAPGSDGMGSRFDSGSTGTTCRQGRVGLVSSAGQRGLGKSPWSGMCWGGMAVACRSEERGYAGAGHVGGERDGKEREVG
jgi:hypothetical protein